MMYEMLIESQIWYQSARSSGVIPVAQLRMTTIGRVVGCWVVASMSNRYKSY